MALFSLIGVGHRIEIMQKRNGRPQVHAVADSYEIHSLFESTLQTELAPSIKLNHISIHEFCQKFQQ